MRARPGMMLIEVMVALAILASVGGACLLLTATAIQSVDAARRAERRAADANSLLSAVSLWTAEDLDRRLGMRRQGVWLLEVQRETRELYSVTIRDSVKSVVLTTALYRPDRR